MACATPVTRAMTSPNRKATSGGTITASRSAASGLSSLRATMTPRSEEHTSELQSQSNLVCRLLLEKKNIRDVISFPKTQKAQCPMTDAPSPVDQKQLKKLTIKLDKLASTPAHVPLEGVLA